MIGVRIRYVVEAVDRHGNVRLYLRRQGLPKIRLPASIGSEAFWSAYRDALAGRFQIKPSTKIDQPPIA
jgi:hypothetical protein